MPYGIKKNVETIKCEQHLETFNAEKGKGEEKRFSDQ